LSQQELSDIMFASVRDKHLIHDQTQMLGERQAQSSSALKKQNDGVGISVPKVGIVGLANDSYAAGGTFGFSRKDLKISNSECLGEESNLGSSYSGVKSSYNNKTEIVVDASAER
jgi:hypothetical protein